MYCKELRAYIRCDLRIVNEKGISLVFQKLNIIYWCMDCPCTFFYLPAVVIAMSISHAVIIRRSSIRQLKEYKYDIN